MNDSYLRRTVLGTLGALTLGSTAAATDEKQDAHCTTEPSHCDACEHTCKQKQTKTHDQRDVGSITVRNRAKCQRMIELSVTGVLGSAPSLDEDLDHSTSTLHVPPEDMERLWFTGSIQRLECEHADFDISIRQRSLDHGSGCDRTGPVHE